MYHNILKNVIYISIIGFFSAIVISGCGSNGGEDSSIVDTNFTKIAKESKLEWIETIPSKESIEYGLMNEDEFNLTKVSDYGLPVYLLSKESVENYSSGNQLDLKSLNEMKFLVRVDKQIRSMITVSTISKTSVAFGESIIANQFNSIFSFLKSKDVDIYQLKSLKLIYFFHGESRLTFLYEQKNNWLIPLSLARKALNIEDVVSDESLFKTEKMMQKLKQYASKQ